NGGVLAVDADDGGDGVGGVDKLAGGEGERSQYGLHSYEKAHDGVKSFKCLMWKRKEKGIAVESEVDESFFLEKLYQNVKEKTWGAAASSPFRKVDERLAGMEVVPPYVAIKSLKKRRLASFLFQGSI
ncbi:MAG: hypothetical protein Q9157_003076, partial [Trypethelium eluteriae]